MEGTKVEIKGMNIIEEALKEINGKVATISTSHILYGGQVIRCQLDYIYDENRVGFRVKNGQEIFVYKKEIRDFGIKDGIYFADGLMKISIKLHRQ